MAEECNALISNHTWDFVHAQPCLNLVGSEWVYRVKYRLDGNVERHKARLNTQGFHQQVSVDYHKTFGPIVKSTTICLILSTTAFSMHWPFIS